MRVKTVKTGGDREIIYSDKHWELLWGLRGKAETIMHTLERYNIRSFLHGSPARGDVHEESDVDITILDQVPSFNVEIAVSTISENYQKEIVQATPNHTIKGHIHMQDNVTITFPLSKFTEREHLFYRFGGIIDLKQIENRTRVPGVNKKLILIQPTEQGHTEFPIVNHEERTAKILNIDTVIVRERIRVLSKRDEKGRTGIFLKVELAPHETFEGKLKQIADRSPAVRHRLKMKN